MVENVLRDPLCSLFRRTHITDADLATKMAEVMRLPQCEYGDESVQFFVDLSSGIDEAYRVMVLRPNMDQARDLVRRTLWSYTISGPTRDLGSLLWDFGYADSLEITCTLVDLEAATTGALLDALAPKVLRLLRKAVAASPHLRVA